MNMKAETKQIDGVGHSITGSYEYNHLTILYNRNVVKLNRSQIR
jgi:hypothetical protein